MNDLKEEARKLRENGFGIAEIGEKLGIPERQAKYFVDDIKLTPWQQRQKSLDRRRLVLDRQLEKRSESVDEVLLRQSLKRYGIFGTRQRLHIGDALVRFCVKKWGIQATDIAVYPRKSKAVRPTECGYCGKPYPVGQRRMSKFCSTCYCQIHRLLSKVRAVQYKGGRCSNCGLEANDENYAAFDFHHSNGDKDSSVSVLLTGKWAELKVELDKCVLLCAICHRVVHSKYNDQRLVHIVRSLVGKSCPVRDGIDGHQGLTDGTGWGGLFANQSSGIIAK